MGSSGAESAAQGTEALGSSAQRSAGDVVLVCGGRQYEERGTVNSVLSALHAQAAIGLIVTGGATGADLWAKLWAQHSKVPVCEFPANWRFEGRASGPRRNAHMLRFLRPSLVVAFPGGPGTADMTGQALAAGIRVHLEGSRTHD
jgi:hypothetical protein